MVKFLAVLLVLVAFGGFLWASDRITLQGERTVYTVQCVGGEWRSNRCTGRLAAGDRHTFRASKSRQEVLYWIVGSPQRSGRFSECEVRDRGNWACKPGADQPLTITREMKHDVPVPGPEGATLPFHAVPKWKWWAIRQGLGGLVDAAV